MSDNKELKNLKTLASTAKEGGNWTEANDYYNKILEIDAEDYDAWFGKGLSIINTSKIGDIKMAEAITCYKNAIKFSNDDNAKKIIALAINNSVTSFYPSIKNHYVEFKSTNNAQIEFTARFITLEAGLAFGIECDPENETIAKNGLDLIRNYKETLGSGMLKILVDAKVINPDEIKVKYLDIMKKVNPDYEEPKEKSGCFVATATMGSYDHPVVLRLRYFRDNYLKNSNYGRAFINVYYKYGPYLAKLIEGSVILKKISYHLLISPLDYFIFKIINKKL